MRRWLLIALLGAPGCAHGEKEALAVLAVSVDETAHLYAEAKRQRLVQCQGEQNEVDAKDCMGPYYGDKGTQLLETIVEAQKAMTAAVRALAELRELTGK